MGPNIDSDRDFAIQGRVLSLVRGRPEGSYLGKDEYLVTLVIESSGAKHTVDLPIKTETDFEVIPYQSALVGVDVRYFKKYSTWEEGIAEDWVLEVLSGSLQGNTYRFTRA
jgi:hypothetical protein